MKAKEKTSNDILKPFCSICFWFGTLAENCCLQCIFGIKGEEQNANN